jgi:hypothetical protein
MFCSLIRTTVIEVTRTTACRLPAAHLIGRVAHAPPVERGRVLRHVEARASVACGGARAPLRSLARTCNTTEPPKQSASDQWNTNADENRDATLVAILDERRWYLRFHRASDSALHERSEHAQTRRTHNVHPRPNRKLNSSDSPKLSTASGYSRITASAAYDMTQAPVGQQACNTKGLGRVQHLALAIRRIPRTSFGFAYPCVALNLPTHATQPTPSSACQQHATSRKSRRR